MKTEKLKDITAVVLLIVILSIIGFTLIVILAEMIDYLGVLIFLVLILIGCLTVWAGLRVEDVITRRKLK